MGPLSGYRILDLSELQSGPVCTQIMQDLGAEVIKLEKPVGDPSRFEGACKNGYSTEYTGVNRGKKSVLMDLGDPRQKALFLKMVETAHVVVTNGAPGTMENYQCGFEDLKKINPRLVVTAITPFGLTGPMRDVAADDMTVQALSGLMAMVGDLGHECVKVGVDMADLLAAYYGFIGTMAALYAVETTGEGRLVDIAALDAVLSANEAPVSRYYMADMVPSTQGNKHPSTVPFGDYVCGDGKRLILNISTDDQFAKFAEVMEAPELLEGGLQYAAERVAQRDRAEELIEAAMLKFDSETIKARLTSINAPYGVINDVQMIAESEHMEDHKMLVDVVYPDGTTLRCVGNPIRIADMERPQTYAASPLGYDTIAVASQYLSEEEVHDLYDQAVAEAEELVNSMKGVI